jgi:hypothetical protein
MQRVFFVLAEEYREILQQDLGFRCGFEDPGAVEGNVLWLNGTEDTSEVNEESVPCQP